MCLGCPKSYLIGKRGIKEYIKMHRSKLLLIIDKIDDLHKMDILACVFDHYITGDINYSQFTRIHCSRYRTNPYRRYIFSH